MKTFDEVRIRAAENKVALALQMMDDHGMTEEEMDTVVGLIRSAFEDAVVCAIQLKKETENVQVSVHGAN